MNPLKPFWSYYGGKWRAAPLYPKPLHDTIIEPFAGAAGYSLRYHERKVILVEKYPVIAEIWRYLIGAREREILAIPSVEHVDELPGWVPQGARWLVGFCMNTVCYSPRLSLSAGARKNAGSGFNAGWSQDRRERVASQVSAIRHWQVVEGDYTAAPDVEATWFIDPPYQRAGTHYKCSSKAIDFAALGAWCRTRRGLTMVCEAEGANWLPFRPLATLRAFGAGGQNQTSNEVVWP